jgi:hypothetical protein
LFPPSTPPNSPSPPTTTSRTASQLLPHDIGIVFLSLLEFAITFATHVRVVCHSEELPFIAVNSRNYLHNSRDHSYTFFSPLSTSRTLQFFLSNLSFVGQFSIMGFIDMARPSKTTNGVGVQVEDTQICVVMVGLPARGKSLIAQKGTFLRVLHPHPY